MRSGSLVALCVVLAALAASEADAQAPAAADGALVLTAGSGEVGWVALAVRGPANSEVDVREVVGGRRLPVARLALAGGTGAIQRASRWVCHRRVRRFSATTVAAAGTPRSATASIVTPSCARRLRLIVTPARVRPGGFVNVRVSDSWRRGAISARICARSGARSLPCTPIRVGAGVRRARVRLARPGRWTIALRSAAGRPVARHVAVRRDARPRIVVTGDSMVLGIVETIARELGRGRSVTGDPHSSTGISKPTLFDWPAHARRAEPADATVVFLGAADGGFPLALPGGATVPCCGPEWVAEYARRIRGMMASYLRGGRGLVYWTLLPTPRSPARAEVFRAIDAAARRAAGTFADGVRLVGTVADVLAPQGRYTDAIDFKGRRRVVRGQDGIHLTAAGVHIASAIIVRALRRDGMLG